MNKLVFTSEEKSKMFDEIASNYYCRNFGLLSKSEMDLLMFRFFIEKLENETRCDDNMVNYQACSDYQISKALGITEQRVRSLKVRYQLKYGHDIDWKAAFAKLIDNARYDEQTRKIVVNIPDPNLFLEIQNYIEENGAYVEKQLNGKILQLRAEYFLALVIESEPEATRKQIIKELKKQFNSAEKAEREFQERNIGKSLIDAACNLTTVAANISSLISPENTIGVAVLKLLTSIRN